MSKNEDKNKTPEAYRADFPAKLINNGKITIPKLQRTLLNLKEGDTIHATIQKITNKKEPD